MWWLIAVAYKEVTHAYGAPMHAMSVTKVLLLMGSSMIGSMVQLAFKGPGIADWIERRFSHLAGNLGHLIAQRVREFAAGLHTIHSPLAFIELSAVSVLMWWLIAVAYK